MKLRMFLPQVAEDIGTEVKYQRDFLEQVVCNFAVFVIFCLFRILGGEESAVEGLGPQSCLLYDSGNTETMCFRRFKFYRY